MTESRATGEKLPVNPEHLRLSASQIKQWESCNRQYFYERVKKIEVRKSFAQGLGTEVHTLAENWLRDAVPPPATKAGQILRSGLSLLPAPKTPGLEIERKFEFDIAPNVSVVGYMDVRLPGTGVWDLKTSGNVELYALTATQLVDDIQPQLYGYVEASDISRGPHDKDVELRWVYFATKGAPRARSVNALLPYEKALEGVDRGLRAAKVIAPLKLAPETKPEDIPGNYKHCDAYGGCPHRVYCPVRTRTIADLFGPQGDDVGLKERLLEKLKGEAVVAVSETTDILKTSEGIVAPPVVAQGVNPPDATLSPDDQPESATSVTTTEEKPKRTRRTKAEMNAANSSVATIVSSGTVLVPVQTTVVYVDCLPIKTVSSVLPAEILIAKAVKVLQEKHGLADYRLADYGKGAPLLLIEFSKLYDDLPKPIALSISSRTPEGSVVLSFLIDRADQVVKGI